MLISEVEWVVREFYLDLDLISLMLNLEDLVKFRLN